VAKELRPKLASLHIGKEKVVFVEFEEGVPWKNVVGTMDSIRSIATDASHDEIKVALKLKEDQPNAPAPAKKPRRIVAGRNCAAAITDRVSGATPPATRTDVLSRVVIRRRIQRRIRR